MTCLLTGGSGFLGKLILHEVSKQCVVKTLCRNECDYCFDLANSIPDFSEAYDIVINGAGLAHVDDRNLVDRNEFYFVNVKGTENLLEGLRLGGLPKKLVYISSVSVYGIVSGENIDEDTALLAKDAYGQSKIMAECVVQEWCKTFNIPLTILRLPLIIGENAPGNLGSMFRAIRSGFYFNVAGGKAKKSMILASDFSQHILRIAGYNGIYNLTDGYNPSFFELSNYLSSQLGKGKPKNIPLWLAKLLALCGDLFGRKVPLNSVRLRKLTSNLTFDDSKARNMFDWKPTPVLIGFKIKNTN
jgi:nucleoside-diphosphate-sugar epimerase